MCASVFAGIVSSSSLIVLSWIMTMSGRAVVGTMNKGTVDGGLSNALWPWQVCVQCRAIREVGPQDVHSVGQNSVVMPCVAILHQGSRTTVQGVVNCAWS